MWCFYAIAAGKGSTGKGWWAAPDSVMVGPTALAMGRAEGKENYIRSASVLWLARASALWWCQTATRIFGAARWSCQARHAVFPSVYGHIFIFSLHSLSHTTYIWMDTLLKAKYSYCYSAKSKPHTKEGLISTIHVLQWFTSSVHSLHCWSKCPC